MNKLQIFAKINRIIILPKNYLLEKINLNPFLLLLILLIIYEAHINDYLFYSTSTALTIILFMIIFKTPRIIVHLFMITWLIVILYQAVFLTANLSQDFGSDRDEAVEIATSNLLNGKNPWENKSPLGNPITTGPTSILIAIPSVALTNKINSLTFLFWILFFFSLIIAEYHYKNNSFIFLYLLFLMPIMGFQHTIFYSLDEMYYALILFPLILYLLRRNKFFFSGFIFSVIFFNRLSYIFLCAGLYFWWLIKNGLNLKNNLKISLGFFFGTICILLPIIIISGNSLFQKNFILNSFLKSIKGNNQVFSFIKEIGGFFNYQIGQILISFCVIILIFLFSIGTNKSNKDNPFWNISFAALLAFSIIFVPVFSADYILSLIIPLFYGIAFSPFSVFKIYVQ